MFGWWNKRALIDEAPAQWIFDTYAWALRHFDARVFFRESILVTPTNAHFPGRVDSVHGMAELIFEQVKAYAGMAHWPCRLEAQSACSLEQSPRVLIAGALRGSGGIVSEYVEPSQRLLITYNPQQINQPEAMIATYAHTLAHYLGSMAPEAPPGGTEHWPHATELLAIFMGFGLMFANSAYEFRGGCGSCNRPAADRTAFLSQEEALYALGLFATLKGIGAKAVRAHLKKHLRPLYKRALADIQARAADLEALRATADQAPLLGKAADEEAEAVSVKA